MSASLTSPTTPFTQSTLPSKSLLSRESTATTFDPALANGGPAGGRGHAPLSVQRSMEDHLQAVIDQLFEKCFCEGRYRQVIGIAIEARNLDVLKGAILRAMDDESKRKMTTEEKQKKKINNGRKETSNGKRPGEGTAGKGDELMEYVLDMCMTVVQERSLRNAVKLSLPLLTEPVPRFPPPPSPICLGRIRILTLKPPPLDPKAHTRPSPHPHSEARLLRHRQVRRLS